MKDDRVYLLHVQDAIPPHPELRDGRPPRVPFGYRRAVARTNLVVLNHDVARVFPDVAKSVNRALRRVAGRPKGKASR